jgi:hypothetical protein
MRCVGVPRSMNSRLRRWAGSRTAWRPDAYPVEYYGRVRTRTCRSCVAVVRGAGTSPIWAKLYGTGIVALVARSSALLHIAAFLSACVPHRRRSTPWTARGQRRRSCALRCAGLLRLRVGHVPRTPPLPPPLSPHGRACNARRRLAPTYSGGAPGTVPEAEFRAPEAGERSRHRGIVRASATSRLLGQKTSRLHETGWCLHAGHAELRRVHRLAVLPVIPCRYALVLAPLARAAPSWSSIGRDVTDAASNGACGALRPSGAAAASTALP